MAKNEIKYSVRDSIATVTLNRPDRMNALTPTLEVELHKCFNRADNDRAVRAIILTGSGSAFCAGYDQDRSNKDTSKARPQGQSIADYIAFWHRNDGERVTYWQNMWRLTKPIIAAVNGWAMGGGFWYQLAADITIASDRAVFAQPEVRHISNSTFLFAALCGWKNANRWSLTGDHFDAEEALRIGMVNEVVAHDELMSRSIELARRIALTPEPSVRLNKAITMLGIQASGLYSGLLLEGALGALAHASHNEYREMLFELQSKEGVKAFLRRRDAPYQPEPMGPRSKRKKHR